MNDKVCDYNLITRMLKEFVVITQDSSQVHPDICDKGAAAIESLLLENEKLKNLLDGRNDNWAH